MAKEENPLKEYQGNMLGALQKTLKYNPASKQQILKQWICKNCGISAVSQDKPLDDECGNTKHNWIVEG